MKNTEKYAVFQAVMVTWGKNSTGRYGQIGVYRVNLVLSNFTYTLYTQVKQTTMSAKYTEVALTSLSKVIYSSLHSYICTITI